MNLPKIFKYLPLFLLIFFLAGFLTTKTALAMVVDGGSAGSPSLYWFKEALKKSEQNLESFVGGKELLPEIEEGQLKQKPSGIMPGVVNSLTAMIIGLPLTEEEISAGYVPSTGAVGGVSNLIAAMYANPPASGVQYLADLGRNLGIVTPAYAQAGVGFRGLSPILPIWKAFRNIAYLFFVIIFVVIGFAIMFRVKISPQAVITIQSALPRIIMALILVTFSFAIAGFLIDLIYVLIALLGMAAAQTGFESAAKVQSVFFKANPLTLFIEFFWQGGGMAGRIANILNPLAYIPGYSLIPEIIQEVLEFLGLVFSAPSQILQLILVIILLFAFFKLFITLLTCYVKILIGVVFGPIMITFSVIPGVGGIQMWLKNLLSNILVFPAVVGMFLLAHLFMKATERAGTLWAPPFLYPSLTPQGLTSAQFIGGLIAYGILLLTPKVADIVQSVFAAKPFPYGAAIGEAFGPTRMFVPATVAGTGEKFISDYMTAHHLLPEDPRVRAMRATLDALVKTLSRSR